MANRILPASDPFFREHGQIFRERGSVIVRAPGPLWFRPRGIECENPRAKPDQRIYRRVISNREVLLPSEEAGLARLLHVRNCVILGMTGYSQLKARDLRQWHIQPGAYEEACAACLASVVDKLHGRYPGVRIKLLHGNTPRGVDLAVLNVAAERSLDNVGFSCPRYMLYAED